MITGYDHEEAAQARFEAEVEAERLADLDAMNEAHWRPWHPDMSCGHIDCVNGCDGAPDYCAKARSALASQPQDGEGK